MLTDGDTKENARCEGQDGRAGSERRRQERKTDKQASKRSAGDSDTPVASSGGKRNTQTKRKEKRQGIMRE